MKIPVEGNLLRIFVGEQDKWHGAPLYEAIIQLARKEGMAGATAIKGFMGFGAKSHRYTSKLLRLSEDLPIVIKMGDSDERVHAFLPHLDELVKDGLMTLERVRVIMYRTVDSQ
jgi:uncharacterized protein